MHAYIHICVNISLGLTPIYCCRRRRAVVAASRPLQTGTAPYILIDRYTYNVYINKYMRIRMNINMYAYIHICVIYVSLTPRYIAAGGDAPSLPAALSVQERDYICACRCTWMFMSMYIYIYICLYIYIYVYVYLYIYLNI